MVVKHSGRGLLNTLINKLPFEMHIPGYKYCGPGTKLAKRLARGDRGVNDLDEACKLHDISYAQNKDVQSRHEADNLLANKALERLLSSNASLGEKAAALGVSTAMKTKVKLGMGHSRRKGALSFKDIAKTARNAIKRVKNGNDAIKIAMKAVNKIKKRKIKPVRIIAVPKKGGFLPLIPIFAGLSAIGALTGGAAGVAKAVSDAQAAKDQLKENQRHNEKMEAIAIGKGLYLKPYKTGLGLYLKKKSP
jgi:hypothetical protein